MNKIEERGIISELEYELQKQLLNKELSKLEKAINPYR